MLDLLGKYLENEIYISQRNAISAAVFITGIKFFKFVISLFSFLSL